MIHNVHGKVLVEGEGKTRAAQYNWPLPVI